MDYFIDEDNWIKEEIICVEKVVCQLSILTCILSKKETALAGSFNQSFNINWLFVCGALVLKSCTFPSCRRVVLNSSNEIWWYSLVHTAHKKSVADIFKKTKKPLINYFLEVNCFLNDDES